MDFQGGMIVLIVFVSLFAIWLLFYFIPVGLWFSALVSGVRISLLQLVLMRWRKVPPSTIVSSMIESTKAGLSARSQRAGGALPRGRQRHERGARARFGAEGQHHARFQDGDGDRPGGPRRVRGRADVGQPEGDQHASRGRRGKGRHSADRQGPRHGARQHQAAGRRRRRGDRAGACGRGHRFVDRFGRVA